jgi:phosphate/sulfate permease
MNKKIIVASVAGAVAGIVIYLVSKKIMEKKQKSLLKKRDDELRKTKPKRAYAYEYTL